MKIFFLFFFWRQKKCTRWHKQTNGHGDSTSESAQWNRCSENPAYGQYTALLCVCDSGVPIIYHGSMSIPWVYVYTMSSCLYNESMAIPWVHVFTMSPCLYHESLSMPWVHDYTMSPCMYHETLLITIPWVKKFNSWNSRQNF